MNMKSNQRREAEQLDWNKEQQQDPLRKLVEAEVGERSSGVSFRLFTQSHRLQEQAGKSKTMIYNLDRNNQYSAKAKNYFNHIDRKSSTLSSSHHQINHSSNDPDHFTQTMYNPTTMQSKSSRRYASVLSARRRRLTTNVSTILGASLSNINRPSLALVVIALALSSCIYITHIQAFQTIAEAPDSTSSSSTSSQSSPPTSSSSSSSPTSQSLASSVASSALSSLSSAIISAALQDAKSGSSDKSNLPTSSGGSETASSGSPTSSAGSSSLSSQSSAPTSIAASLSSAVASAAAAAAVAAAQNSLSGGDARSLITGSSSMLSPNTQHLNNHHNSRNTGLNLALKLADAIPEVPYNILHNMKKLDHAAPFYNVGNKGLTYSGNSKESTHGFLASALHASGGLGGAAEQLSSLFRSPIWKRIADGYGEFTSEFRSLFRGPPTTMKGPSSSATSKLLRDISVPALLMILASTIPSDWRPVRTRRKSLIPSDLAPTYNLVDPMMASASSDLPNYSAAPQLFGSTPNFNIALQQQPQQQIISQQQQQQQIAGRGLNPLAQMYNQLDHSVAARINDIDLQQVDAASTVHWMQPSVAQSESTGQMHNYATQMHQIQLHQHNPQQHQPQQLQQSIRRFGDSLPSALSSASDAHSNVKPVNSGRLHSNNLSASSVALSSDPLQSSAGSLFSSLTSGLVNQVGHSKLMNRLMNANTASIGGDNLKPANSYRMAGNSMDNELKIRRDNLSDKHRYSLVNSDNDNMRSRNSLNEHQQSAVSTKPFLLSAMTQAIGSMIANSPLKSGYTSSNSGSNGIIINKMFTLHGNNLDNGILQNSFIGDKTLNHHDTILRRNHQTSSGAMEQRELSKFIPQSWKEVVKRTVNSVQEQATTQWRSIEGQLVNWMQDKFKTLPAAGAASSGSSSSQAASVPNILATVGTTALNMLGLGGKSASGSPIVSNSTNMATSLNGGEPASVNSVTSDESSTTTNPVLKNKNDSTKSKQPSAKAGLASVANMIVNTLANRQTPATSQSTSKSKTPNSNGENSSPSTLVSQYPTLTGVQPESGQSTSSSSSSLVDFASPSMASGTASTAARMSII